jgi:hypothetical protein
MTETGWLGQALSEEHRTPRCVVPAGTIGNRLRVRAAAETRPLPTAVSLRNGLKTTKRWQIGRTEADALKWFVKRDLGEVVVELTPCRRTLECSPRNKCGSETRSR